MNKERMGFVALGAVFAGVALFGYGLWAYMKEGEIRNWPHTDGEITESRVVTERSRRRSTGSGRRSSSTRTERYARIEYKYTVQGQSYTSNVVNAADLNRTRGKSGCSVSIFGSATSGTEAVRKYPQGSRARVFYNPDKPAEATLEIQRPFWIDVALWAGLPLALIGFVGFQWIRKNMKATPRQERDA